MPLFSGALHKRNEIVAIDFGRQITKAVYLRRKDSAISLVKYVLVETPIYDKAPSVDLLGELLRQVVKALGTPVKQVAIALGGEDTLLSHAELSAANASDLRKMVKLSPKTYLQQNLPDFVFDCHAGAPSGESPPGGTTRTRRKTRVLVGAMKRRIVEDFQEAAREAGLVVEEITFHEVGVANAARALPAESHAEVAALLDIGFNSSSVGILMNGELAFTRRVHVGAGKLADFFGKSGDLTAAARMAPEKMEEFQIRVHGLISVLGKELGASIDFFETQNEAKVTEIVVSGGAARSQFIVQGLEAEMQIPCETWAPSKCHALQLPERQKSDAEYEGPQLAVAIGAGLGCMDRTSVRINMLAEEQEAAEMRRRDPVRRARWVCAGAVLLTLLWAGYLGFKLQRGNTELSRQAAEVQTLKQNSSQAIATARQAAEMSRTLTALKRQAVNRFFLAPALNALQYVMVPNVRFHNLRIERSVVNEPGAKAVVSNGVTVSPERPGAAVEKMRLVIQGKNFGDPKMIDRLVETISRHPYFREHLRRTDPVLLKDLQPRQVDPANPNQTFQFFTLECFFMDRVYKDE